MATRPKGDLGDLRVPKGDDAPAIEALASPQPARPAAVTGKAYAHTLSLRLSAEQYRRLRQHARRMEDEQGGRITHQSIIEAALDAFLD